MGTSRTHVHVLVPTDVVVPVMFSDGTMAGLVRYGICACSAWAIRIEKDARPAPRPDS